MVFNAQIRHSIRFHLEISGLNFQTKFVYVKSSNRELVKKNTKQFPTLFCFAFLRLVIGVNSHANATRRTMQPHHFD